MRSRCAALIVRRANHLRRRKSVLPASVCTIVTLQTCSRSFPSPTSIHCSPTSTGAHPPTEEGSRDSGDWVAQWADEAGVATFAAEIEQSAADALELNLYKVVTDLSVPSAHIESQVVGVVEEVKRLVKIPVAVKLSPVFTATGNTARRLDEARKFAGRDEGHRQSGDQKGPRSVRACALHPDAPQLDSVIDPTRFSSAFVEQTAARRRSP